MPGRLYPSFLENKRVYNLNQAYWRRLLTDLIKDTDLSFQPYLNPLGPDSTREYDGNPIFNAYFPRLTKAIRIIQDSPEDGAADLSAWLDQIELEESQAPVTELVIAVTLSRKTSAQARELLQQWIVEGCTNKEMQEVIKGLK